MHMVPEVFLVSGMYMQVHIELKGYDHGRLVGNASPKNAPDLS